MSRKSWLFTFGSSHLLGAHGCVIMNDMSNTEARMYLTSMVGDKWAFQYELDYAPTHIVWSRRLFFARDTLPGDLRDPEHFKREQEVIANIPDELKNLVAIDSGVDDKGSDEAIDMLLNDTAIDEGEGNDWW